MKKQVYKFADIRPKILKAVDTIADPVRGTISPKGRNVIFEDQDGALFSTNDGVTIAKSIYVKDPVENAIIQVVKGSSIKTNSEVGDGTSTTILLNQVLVHETFKLIDGGWNPIDLKEALEDFRDKTVAKLKKATIKVRNDKDLENIARISANNDKEIAKNVVQVVKTAGLDGMVFIETNNKLETELIEEVGFQVDGGLFAPEFKNAKERFVAQYQDVPMLITDKRIYYPEEAETILKTVLMAGHKSVVIVAKDFIGQSVNTFISNHNKGIINVLLVKDNGVNDKNSDALYDLADYVGGAVVSEKNGKIVDNLTFDDFIMVPKVFCDPIKTIVTSKNPNNKVVKAKISAIRKELAKHKEDVPTKKRLASLTNGTVTIKVGGATPIEVRERIYRYEDAVSAVRAAVEYGFLVGGGVAIYETFNEKDSHPELVSMFKKYCTANIRQIAENCGEHADSVLKTVYASTKPNTGYNAVTGAVEDLLVAGVVDPYRVTEMSIINSISIASQIINSDYLIIADEEETN